MSLRNVYNLFKTLEQESILLSFKGVVTSDLLSSVLQIMESKLAYLEDSPKIKKKVFNVLVECLQNLYHHIDDSVEGKNDVEEIETKSAVFMIARVDGNFHVRTGNYIDKESGNELLEKLERINSLTKDELKAYYQEVLSLGALSEKGTAGLGMIDIARKSGNKLEYDFIEVNEEFDFFCLNVKID